MSNPYTGTVTSALRKSELLLAGRPAQGLQAAALREAALMQLWRAYLAYLAELSFQLQLGLEPQSAAELQQRLQASAKASGEVAELIALEEDPCSWLSQLLACWRLLWRPGKANAGAQVGVDLISTGNRATANPESLNDVRLRAWHLALQELVQRHRAHTEEW
ncbi:DUF6586 family protein [Microbulbifer sp. 2201CG32-9]|uniref:DUF6586 family protein n=1 Tax=Microbulbifer sp. 2201CG32-9 TaxID=3232309 RepID=UPI00345BDC99